MGVKKSDLDNTIGIHPTIAEEFVNLKITKNSGKEYEKTSCWAWLTVFFWKKNSKF